MWEQPHEWVPLVILALVPAGIVWGLDGRLARNRLRARWPA
jgi:cytochrome b